MQKVLGVITCNRSCSKIINTSSLETASVVDRALHVEAAAVWQIRRVHL